MKTETKVYDYNKDKVRATLLNAFRKHGGEAAAADLVSFTGLPKHQVETELPALADEYRGRLKVTESGTIVYSFPQGYASRYRGLGPSLKRFFGGFFKVAGKVAAFLFKIWIMVMLVGYFVLFLALVVFAIVASIALSVAGSKGSSSRSRGSSGMFGLTMGLVRAFMRIWFYSELFESPQQRQREMELRLQRGAKAGAAGGEKRPMHRRIFSFIFGEIDPNAGHDQVERRLFVALAQQGKGMVLLEEFMALTGLSADQADLAISRYLYEFEGSPEVTANGTIYYHFPKLLERARAETGAVGLSAMQQPRPFSANSRKANAGYALINGVNLLFGGFFLYAWQNLDIVSSYGKGTQVAEFFYSIVYLLFSYLTPDPRALIGIALGVVPIVFSLLFWLVPLVRAGRVKAENRAISQQNLRRTLYARVLENPTAFNPHQIGNLPATVGKADSKALVKTTEALAAYEQAESLTGDSWNFAELQRKLQDIAAIRRAVKADDYKLGDTVFDTNEPG